MLMFRLRNRCCARDDVVIHLRSIYARANPGTGAADIATLQFYLFDNSAGRDSR